MPSIHVENLVKHYQVGQQTIRAVDGVSYRFEGNKTYAIIGPSGSGKSTLINLLGLITYADSGKILLNGEDVSTYSDSRRSALRNSMFGYVVQDFALIKDESAYRNIEIPLLYNKLIPRKEYKNRIQTAASSLSIEDKLPRVVTKLSGGERQRVAVARATVCDQPIILADEPTGSLDAQNKDLVIDLLMDICKERQTLLIVVTHDLAIADRCDKVIEMKDGKIKED